ncbi:MAG: Eco57I restriction-modification methylase domain-containing protein [Promethearchaeota archaeon]
MFTIFVDQKKNLGLVITPKKTADYIVSRLGPIKRNDKILDPCTGPGVFIESLLNRGVQGNQIYAYDINNSFQESIKDKDVNFKAQDTLLSLYPDSYNEFDFVVGNPPYLNKSSTYVSKYRQKLKKIYGKINAHETYSMFIVNAIWRLKEGGKLGFITSDSFLTLNTHTKLRKFILQKCKINEILLAPVNLFNNQNVSTSPVIIILTKCTGETRKVERQTNIMRIIPRIKNEDGYQSPLYTVETKQEKYHLLPFNIFFTELENGVIQLFKDSPRLEEFVKGYIGMHTHNNLKYIAAVENTELGKIFQKRNKRISDPQKKNRIVAANDLNSEMWKPYLKRGGADRYYRPVMEALDWEKSSISNYDIPKNVPFEKEGIVISGVSSRLAARYMPEGCYWDSNKAIGFEIKDDSISINYLLGLLNSSLYNYLAKGIINNTNSLQLTGIHALPFVIPDNTTKGKVEELVDSIIFNKKEKEDYDYLAEQKEIDNVIFNLYSGKFHFTKKLKVKLDDSFSEYRKD